MSALIHRNALKITLDVLFSFGMKLEPDAIMRLYLGGTSGITFVYDVYNLESFENIKHWFT